MAGDEIIKVEKDSIDRFVALGLGRYDAITAVDAGIDSLAVERWSARVAARSPLLSRSCADS